MRGKQDRQRRLLCLQTSQLGETEPGEREVSANPEWLCLWQAKVAHSCPQPVGRNFSHAKASCQALSGPQQPPLHPALDFLFFKALQKALKNSMALQTTAGQRRVPGWSMPYPAETPKTPAKLVCGDSSCPSLMFAKCFAWRVQHQRAVQRTPALFRLCHVL